MSTANESPNVLNIADVFLEARLREGRGDRTALVTPSGALTYRELDESACAIALSLQDSVQPEQRVLVSLPDGWMFPAALFATFKLGAVAVMVNPGLADADLRTMVLYVRPRAIITTPELAGRFGAAIAGMGVRCDILEVTEPPTGVHGNAPAQTALESFPTHPDDAALWLFSGGTTGTPKAVVQTHRSFVNTTKLYGGGVIGYREDDVTISVPKLYFGYATGSNLFFPMSAGATSVLFPEPPTAELLFELIAKHRATILINVPTMIHKMLESPAAKSADLSSLRLCTSAGEALPAELYTRWKQAFGVELLDGLGTAEMWHIFISNAPGRVKPGTLGQVVPGFEIKACDDYGNEVPR